MAARNKQDDVIERDPLQSCIKRVSKHYKLIMILEEKRYPS